jgi:hypothetical protein
MDLDHARELVFHNAPDEAAALTALALGRGPLQDRLGFAQAVRQWAQDDTFASVYAESVSSAENLFALAYGAMRDVVQANTNIQVQEALGDDSSELLQLWVAFFTHYLGHIFIGGDRFDNVIQPAARTILVAHGQLDDADQGCTG